jgi:hypothetical protein
LKLSIRSDIKVCNYRDRVRSLTESVGIFFPSFYTKATHLSYGNKSILSLLYIPKLEVRVIPTPRIPIPQTAKQKWAVLPKHEIQTCLKTWNPSVDKLIRLSFGHLRWLIDHKNQSTTEIQAFISAIKKCSKLFFTRKKGKDSIFARYMALEGPIQRYLYHPALCTSFL